MRICSIDACGSKHYGKGFCFKHYYRQYKHGSPVIIKKGSRYPAFKTMKESLEAKFMKGKNNECWNWTHATSNHGYGSFTFNGKRYIASRLAYEIYIGPIEKGHHICHKCDNPKCVNPSHLFSGTIKENMSDMVKKNRSAKGQNHSQSKLNDRQVKIIKKLIKQNRKNIEIAAKFNINRRTVNHIKSETRWSHIT